MKAAPSALSGTIVVQASRTAVGCDPGDRDRRRQSRGRADAQVGRRRGPLRACEFGPHLAAEPERPGLVRCDQALAPATALASLGVQPSARDFSIAIQTISAPKNGFARMSATV